MVYIITKGGGCNQSLTMLHKASHGEWEKHMYSHMDQKLKEWKCSM